MKRFARVIFMVFALGAVIVTTAIPAKATEQQRGNETETLELIQRLRTYAEQESEENAVFAEDLLGAADELERLMNREVEAEAETENEENRYSSIKLSQSQKKLLACIIWLEARGESFEGQQGVAEVVFNRMLADNFPDDLREVLYAEGQFPTVEQIDVATPDETQYAAIESALSGPYVLPLDVVFFAQFPVNENIWGEIGGHVFCYQWWWKGE